MSPQERELVAEIVTEARNKLFEKVGPHVRLVVRFVKTVAESDIEGMFRLCDEICGIWEIGLEDLSTPFRGERHNAMRQVIWYAAHKNFPYVPLKVKAELLRRKEHTNVLHALAAAKDRIDTNDGLFMSYYNPIKHLIHAK